jgi:hypothetical protein
MSIASGLLDRLTLEEKVSLLAAVDWWRTPTISREDVFVPHIKVSKTRRPRWDSHHAPTFADLM